MDDKMKTETAQEIAALLTSGLHGTSLLSELQRRFSHAKRYDVFLGVTLAMTLYEADLSILQAEAAITQKPQLAS